MINTTLDKIDKAIIESLITNSVAESRTLEYKEALPGRSEKDNHEFLADVTAIANSSGGDLVYGIREKRDVDNKPTGEPQEACGIGQPNLDEEIRRLDNLLRTLVDPRISGILIRQIDGFPNGPVIIYRIQKSWAAPHMIRMSSRFYARTTREKYPMDVREIRAAFALSDALPDRIRRFRDDRLAKIVSDETPLPVMSGAKIALHVLPVAAFEPGTSLSPASLIGKLQTMRPLRSRMGHSVRFNFDGVMWFCQPPPPVTQGTTYVQMFRNGAIEAVEAYMLFPRGDEKVIPSTEFEQELMQGLQVFLDALKILEFQPPVFVMLTLIGVKGYVMYCGQSWDTGRTKIDRDVLMLPDGIVEDLNEKPEKILRPMFDGVWQASGMAGSPNYDEKDNWRRRV